MKLSLDRVLSRFASLTSSDKQIVLETFYPDAVWLGGDTAYLLAALLQGEPHYSTRSNRPNW